jgi:hypothetical protein
MKMKWTGNETLVRFVRLRDDLKPLPIYLDGPISPDWIGITHCVGRWERRTDMSDDFIIYFMTDDGRDLEFEQYETLEIALDQAHGRYGIRKDEWVHTNQDVDWSSPLTWKKITQP